MTTNINNSPEYACRTCAKQECGCKDTECQLPCHFYTEQAEQPVSQEYQDHLVNQSFDWAAMAAKHQFMEGYRIGLAEMREKCATVVTEHAPTCSPHWVSYVVAIRAINFEGDTGFRPVSEMVAEHKQDPKKAAAIEKAKMRKAEQEPVGYQIRVRPHGAKWLDWKDCSKSEYEKVFSKPPAKYHDYDARKLYAAPVRTKDLTAQEKANIIYAADHRNPMAMIDAAIALYREKNK